MSTGTQPIRLAFCITELDPGGAERALWQLATRLDRARWEPRVYCLSGPGPLVAEFEQAGIPVTCFGAASWRHVSVVRRLAGALRGFRPAVLQTFLFHANMVGRLAGRWANVPHIVSGIRVAERRSRLRLWLDRATERLVERHVCVSQAVAQFSIERGGLRAEKVVVISNGVDARRFAEAEPASLLPFGIPANARTVLFVGRLDPQKGPFVLLEAAKNLVPTYGDLHVLLVGDGPLRSKIRRWVEDHALDSRVHVAGYRQDVAELMRAATCLVLPSRWEGLPNVILEAMAAGLPVIATNVDGTSELIRNHQTGLLVSPDSPRELAAALALVLGDSGQAGQMAAAAQHIVVEQFMWEAMVEKFEQLYQNLVH